MKSEQQPKRLSEVKIEEKIEVVILPGDPLDFERLHARLVAEAMPDGILEENTVRMIAKRIWREHEYQKLMLSEVVTPSVDMVFWENAKRKLLAFHKMLVEGADEKKIRNGIIGVGIPWHEDIDRRFPQKDFENTDAWAKAIAEFVETERARIANGLEQLKNPVVRREIKPVTHELLERELRFEERNEAAIQRSIDRLRELKQAKRPISLREMQRFERTHPDSQRVKISRYSNSA